MTNPDQQTSPVTKMTDCQGLRLNTSGIDVPEKSISEKVAEARRNRRECTPTQRLLMRTNSRTVTTTTRALLLSSDKRCSSPKTQIPLNEFTTQPINGGAYSATTTNAGTVLDPSPTTNNDHNGSGTATTTDGHHVDAPSVQAREDSTKTFRRGRSLFRSSAPKVRRHARPPFPIISKIEEETAEVIPLRRLESLSPKPRFAKGGANRLSRGRQKHKGHV